MRGMKPTMVFGLARHTSCAKSKLTHGTNKSSSTLKTAEVLTGSFGRKRLFSESTVCNSYSSRGTSPVSGKRLVRPAGDEPRPLPRMVLERGGGPLLLLKLLLLLLPPLLLLLLLLPLLVLLLLVLVLRLPVAESPSSSRKPSRVAVRLTRRPGTR